MNARIARVLAIAACTALLAGVITACGSGDESPGQSSKPPDYEDALAGAPGPLVALYEQGGELLGGGVEAFQGRLAKLRGYPVVVNKWASWCGPCRAEFPFFQSQAAKHGTKVAFLGVNSNDSEDAAGTFLEEFPVPYPSYSDPDSEIASFLEVGIEFPATVFIDSEGNTVFAQRGGYASEQQLAADIERYAR